MSSIKIKGLDEALKSVQKSSRARESRIQLAKVSIKYSTKCNRL